MLYPATCVRLRYGCRADMLSGFSREYGYRRYRLPPKGTAYCRASAQGADLPAPLITFALQPPIPSGGGRVTPPSPRRSALQFRSASPGRLSLRPRLTPGRLASPGNPWPCGGGASHPPCRYLYLHLLFHALQPRSRPAFDARGMLPYRCFTHPRASAAGLIPDYYPCGAPRPVSCYALFE